jgi:ABC-type sugar transport system ATPase subunit
MLHIEQLEVTLDGQRVLGPLDLRVAAGELLVLAGPSGSGKSTLLRALAGLVEPAAGRMLIDGDDLAAKAPGQRGVAMVFQNYALFPHLTIEGNLAFGPRARGERTELAARIAAAAEALGIGALLKRYPRQLSGGERQRVALARALMRRPRLLLLDEPLSNLDAPLRAQARAEILRVHREIGCATIYVTHDQQEALALSDRLGLLDRGQLVQLDTPERVYRRPANLFAAGFLGNPAMNLLPDGEARMLGIRAEHIAVEGSRWAAREVALEAAAQVEHSELFGDYRLLRLRLNDQSVLARVEPEFSTHAGDWLRVGFDARHLCRFDRGSGQALP